MLQWLGQLPEDEDFADRRPARRLTSTYFSMLPSARAAFSVPPRGTSAVGVRERAERAPAPWFGSRCAPRPQNGGARAWTNQGRLVVRKDAQFVGTSRRLQHPRARAAWQQQCPHACASRNRGCRGIFRNECAFFWRPAAGVVLGADRRFLMMENSRENDG